MNKTIHTLKEKELEQKRIYDMMQNKTSKQALEIFKRPAFYGVNSTGKQVPKELREE